MARHNAYAKKLTAVRSAVTHAERQALVHRSLTTIFQAAAVALNEEFGFGADRISRFQAATERIVSEYGDLMHGADVDYADDKLEEAYRRIMEGQR
jgi:hypothetical protein